MKIRERDRWLIERAQKILGNGHRQAVKKSALELAHAKAQRDALEDRLAFDLRVKRAPIPERQYRFAEPRRWRFDFAWPELRVAVEVHGGIFIRGRHSRGAGQVADFEKQNAAVLDGWRVLVFGPPQVMDGTASDVVLRLLDVSKSLGDRE